MYNQYWNGNFVRVEICFCDLYASHGFVLSSLMMNTFSSSLRFLVTSNVHVSKVLCGYCPNKNVLTNVQIGHLTSLRHVSTFSSCVVMQHLIAQLLQWTCQHLLILRSTMWVRLAFWPALRCSAVHSLKVCPRPSFHVLRWRLLVQSSARRGRHWTTHIINHSTISYGLVLLVFSVIKYIEHIGWHIKCGTYLIMWTFC